MRTPTEIIDMLAEKFENMGRSGVERMDLFIRKDRRSSVLIKVIFGLIGVSVTLWVNEYEFGEEIFQSPELILLLALWFGYGIIVLFDELKHAKEETTNEKIDKLSDKIGELIDEIRQERNDRNNKPK